jgi:hypothetical protein
MDNEETVAAILTAGILANTSLVHTSPMTPPSTEDAAQTAVTFYLETLNRLKEETKAKSPFGE